VVVQRVRATAQKFPGCDKQKNAQELHDGQLFYVMNYNYEAAEMGFFPLFSFREAGAEHGDETSPDREAIITEHLVKGRACYDGSFIRSKRRAGIIRFLRAAWILFWARVGYRTMLG
jgi:hypothetical protein